MCRLLLLENPGGIEPDTHLAAFKSLCKNSQEYQGHGWGCAWLDADRQWQTYHHIQPVWQDENCFPATPLFLAHARSAFRDEGIAVENNMPFSDDKNVFLFNGELRGVKIKVQGRIGAEKIFNTIKRFDKGNLADAARRGVMVINKRTRYVRAMNFFLANQHEVHVCSQFAEDPEYFQLNSTTVGNTRIICSRPYDGFSANWLPVENNQLQVISLKH